MFAIGETDKDGKQKRIEHRGKFARVSRTGGVALRAQTKVAGLNVTANTKRGVRVSTRITKGTNIALQNGKFRIKGRYGKGPTKLNLSKSGLSISTKNKLGTFNWFHSNRSSAKLLGIQFRGKRAANLQIFYLLLRLIIVPIKLMLVLFIAVLQIGFVLAKGGAVAAWWLTRFLFRALFVVAFWPVSMVRFLVQRTLSKRSQDILSNPDNDIERWDVPRLENALMYAIAVWGRGEMAEDRQNGVLKVNQQDVSVGTVGPDFDEVAASIPGKNPTERLRSFVVTVSTEMREKSQEARLPELLFEIDDQCIRDGGRTVLQDTLIEDYADTTGLGMEMVSAP